MLRVQVGVGLADHAVVQVQGVEAGGPEFLQDEAGPGAPAATHFQDFRLRVRRHAPADPFDDEALDHDPHRVVDDQPLGPVELHGFTARWITAMPLVRRR